LGFIHSISTTSNFSPFLNMSSIVISLVERGSGSFITDTTSSSPQTSLYVALGFVAAGLIGVIICLCVFLQHNRTMQRKSDATADVEKHCSGASSVSRRQDEWALGFRPAVIIPDEKDKSVFQEYSFEPNAAPPYSSQPIHLSLPLYEAESTQPKITMPAPAATLSSLHAGSQANVSRP
jgi:hypothetical protein